MDMEAIRAAVTQEVYRYFREKETGGRLAVGARDVVGHLEHSLLNPDTTEDTIRKGCELARKYAIAGICVAPYYVPLAKQLLDGSPVKVGTAIGFPHGCMSQRAKLAELRECIENGAEEIDVAINMLAIKSDRLMQAQRELEELLRAAQGKAVLKAVFEHSVYTPDEKRQVLVMLRSAGVEYIKIQNMLSGHGARVEDVELASSILGRMVKIKIDGGIKTLAQAQSLLDAGAERLGLTATAKIAEEARNA